MGDLSRLIMHLALESPTRVVCINEYRAANVKAKALRDSISDSEDRKTATWLIRTANKPVDNAGNPIA
jgi:hypothetical protein